jgi:hypothetical protein
MRVAPAALSVNSMAKQSFMWATRSPLARILMEVAPGYSYLTSQKRTRLEEAYEGGLH